MKKLFYTAIFFIGLGIWGGYELNNKINEYDLGAWGKAKNVLKNNSATTSSQTTDQNINNENNTSMEMSHNMPDPLKELSNIEFDKAFLKQMILHHKDAIEVSKQALEKSKNSEILNLAKNIISNQTTEIEKMEIGLTLWIK